MPIHTISAALDNASSSTLTTAAITAVGLTILRTYLGGRTSTWERESAGKMILIAGPLSPIILALIHHLLHLPSPPQILCLVPFPSPLPEEILTILHTLRIGITNPLAQLHCEPLPRTPAGVREFVRKWSSVEQGLAGEGGRRIDAVLLSSGWELQPEPINSGEEWTTEQFHFHLITALLPHLLRQPAERNIRIISLLSPTWAAAIPSLHGVRRSDSLVQQVGERSLRTLLVMKHFQLILDTLASATYGKILDVPIPDGSVKRRDKSIQSNIMALGVVMPWARTEVVRGLLKVDSSWLRWFLYILFYPIIMFLTPSPRKSMQSILFALSAPVRYSSGPADGSVITGSSDTTTDGTDMEENRRGVQGGDVVRDCAVIQVPPVLSDSTRAKEAYDGLEKEVEGRIKAKQDSPSNKSKSE
ncbi:hypothetical protein TREMEDRAFT_26353 [Tremella mesenterica DSM 1558]|uniref:uncharacterized protein n=1 Tax=Tremella mesenterica (strain ATCC 24925 / CBS 8224 / DSM 1558 / NBRC 9311 / NRRL Y-6157 / RJB 2259-6 / UBC 559-6) TaxID=578456 RepID=UPI0003F4A3B9|nr:uncharacterized protein TREMEDRAFT_26353 [Tremella mesenterica DSM 1558]EIW73115.1 hypothetical protein TREMEDRAFT_26353 [Tremella mesenterica DSM 1558]